LSLFSRRLVATLAALVVFTVASIATMAANLPPSTWVALTPFAGMAQLPVFALAVSPTNDQALIAGNGRGDIYRSANGGVTWAKVHAGKSGIIAIAYSPFNPALIIAGTSNAGALFSTDGGGKWSLASGLDGRAVRALGFGKTLIVAGTDRGIYTSPDGQAWNQSGLSNLSVDAVAVAAVNPPLRILAGGDDGAQAGLPLYQSVDAGTTWARLSPPVSGTIVTHLAAGPLPNGSQVRPIVLGTNTGLFISSDNATNFTALSGGQLLPSTDYTQSQFTATHFDRFYVASDGGGAGSGGLWATGDSGKHFSSLQPPLSSVTALAVSGDELPILFVATFRASDHAPLLWAYHDTGGKPQPPAGYITTPATGARTDSPRATVFDLVRSVLSSQAPYVALGVGAVVVIVLAAISQFRSRRR
jgi:hypothetical protein